MPDRHRSALAADPDIGPIIPHYVARLPAHVARLRELIAANDAGELRNLLHQLRGSGKSYGFATMTQLAGDAEDALYAGKTVGEAQNAFGLLMNFIEHIEGYPA